MKDGSASIENIKLKTVMVDNTTNSCTIETTIQSKLKLLNTEMTKPEANTNSCHGLGEAQRMWPSYISLKVSPPLNSRMWPSYISLKVSLHLTQECGQVTSA